MIKFFAIVGLLVAVSSSAMAGQYDVALEGTVFNPKVLGNLPGTPIMVTISGESARILFEILTEVTGAESRNIKCIVIRSAQSSAKYECTMIVRSSGEVWGSN